jgi:hypothetical protein
LSEKLLRGAADRRRVEQNRKSTVGADRWRVPTADCRRPMVLSVVQAVSCRCLRATASAWWCELPLQSYLAEVSQGSRRRPMPGAASCRCPVRRCRWIAAHGYGRAGTTPLRRVRGWPDGRIGSARARARVIEWRGLYTWSGMGRWPLWADFCGMRRVTGAPAGEK